MASSLLKMSCQPGDLLLNKYRIDSLLGRGAYADVYRALDQQNGAPVAIKALAWKGSSSPANRTGFDEVRARFLQEAALGMRLDHPHLVRVIESSDQSDALLIVMELLPGGSLASRLQALRQGGEPFTLDRAVEIASQVTAGLAALHQKDIIHRDLHPGNILFSEDGSLKIADLGLAQIPGGVTAYSLYGLRGGTAHPGHPDYCSPEHDQVSRRLTPAADIYGLGAILFEMLTGRLYKNLRPGTRLKALRSDIPDWLDELVGEMLLKDPEKRPWDGQAALQALRDGWNRELAQRAELERLRIVAEAQRAAEQRASEEAATRTAEQARIQAELRARKIAQHWQDFQAALQGEHWLNAERALSALAAMGAEEADQASVLRQELERVVQKATDLYREDRYQSATAFKATRQAAPPATAPASTPPVVHPAIKPRPAWLHWTAGALGLIVVGAILIWTWKAFGPQNDPTANERHLLRTGTGLVALDETASASPSPLPTRRPESTPTLKPTLLPILPLITATIQDFLATATAAFTKFPTLSFTPTGPGGMVVEKDGMQMVYVPAGPFLMGSKQGDVGADSDESSQQTVTLDAFWIDRTEVTNVMYTLCVADGACQPLSNASSFSWNAYYNDNDPLYADFPVISISWNDAANYCLWTGRRLPTEAQWEKAARGTDGRIYPWGDQAPTCNLANFRGRVGSRDCVGDSTKVGRYPSGASPYGALDMAGNVWEWVADWYDENYYQTGPTDNPTGPAYGQFRVLRGGAYDENWNFVRAASRNYSDPHWSDGSIGFRCARSP